MAARCSSNDAIDNIDCNDDDVEVQAYVDSVQGRKIVGKHKKLNLLKFSINNGIGKRIQCLAWEGEVDRVAQVVAMDKILHIEGAKAKAISNPRFNIGNVPFEFNIRSITEITVVGTQEIEAVETVEPPIVSWDDVAYQEGQKISVEGWIKFNFRESKHFNNESTQGFGSITDGNKKLEVRLTSMIGLPADLEKGMSVKVTGMVRSGTYLYVKVESGADVIATGHDALDVTTMINITSPPIKKPKLA